MSDWQPIEAAPKDATILLWASGEHVIGYWAVSKSSFLFEGWTTGWETAGGYDVGFAPIHAPTHWMPLPEAP